MNIGFLFSVLAGFVWSWINVIDKVVVSKYIRNPIFIIFILNVVSLVTGVIILLINRQSMAGWAWLWIIFSGLLFTLGDLFYFYALRIEEPSRVVPLFALGTIFTVVISALFLGEVFNVLKYFGITIIILGSIIINSRRDIFSVFKSKVLGLMIISGLGYSASAVINKYLLINYSFWTVFGYQRLLVGLVSFFIVLIYFKEIKRMFLELRKYMFLMSFGEVLNTGAALIFIIATVHWYVSMVSTVASVQYLFLFIWALIISRFKPSLFSEEVNRKVIFQKIAAIILIIGGVFLIS